MFKKLLISAAMAALVAGSATAGRIITVTWTGTIANGTDDVGLFGTAGADLTGTDYTAVYIFNLTHAAYQAYTQDGAVVGTSYSGGLLTGGPTISSAIFTVNGQSLSIGGNLAGGVGATRAPANADYRDPYSDFQAATGEFNTALGAIIFLENDIAEDADHDWGNPDMADYDGDVSAVAPDYSYNLFSLTLFDGPGEMLALNNAHLTIVNSSVPDVPEPASWAMMVSGFGMIGGALRSRRKARVRFI